MDISNILFYEKSPYRKTSKKKHNPRPFKKIIQNKDKMDVDWNSWVQF